MPRRSLLKPSERESLLALPGTEEERIRYYTLTEPDLAVIEQRRGDANRLGFAIQLCYLRYPGMVLPVNQAPEAHVLGFVAQQLRLEPKLWSEYAQRAETRREHLLELQDWLQLRLFGTDDPQELIAHLVGLAQQTDEGLVLATALVERLRMQRILLPGVEVIERVCAEALTLGTRQVYEALGQPLSEAQRQGAGLVATARRETESQVYPCPFRAPESD